MLRIISQSNAQAAQSYYTKADYYGEGQELAGVWQGRAAEMLGLRGQVAKAPFDALCVNQHPHTGERLTVRTKAERRVGWDFNLHVPKSVSVLYGLTRDAGILDAVEEANTETMQAIERDARVRIRRKKKKTDRHSGNLVWASYVHLTARPIQGTPDPHVHIHNFVFNASHDQEEGRWKAAEIGAIKRDAPYFEAQFHSRLARKLTDLGYAVDRTAKAWELAGVPATVLRKFSRRTEQIETLAAAKGITDDAAKDKLGAKTRQGKQKDLSMPELQAEWTRRLTAAERAALDAVASRAAPRTQAVPTAAQAMDYAVRHVFERASVVPERQLLTHALKFGVGSLWEEDLRPELRRHGLLKKKVDDRWFFTTKERLEEEEFIVQFARRGRGTRRRLGHPGQPLQREWLDAGQRAAVQHLLESPDRVLVLRGAAGVGKTSLLQEAVAGIQAAGQRVLAFAPSAEASRGVLRQEGFAGADTVARLLADENLHQEAAGQVWLIDEAGLLGTRTTAEVFRLADRLDARLILCGDRRQHAAVEAGSPLRLLEERAGLKVAEVTDVKRQRGDYKRAIAQLAEGKVGEGFVALDALGWVKEVPEETRYAQLADDYLQAVAAGKTALVISPTHAEGQRITTSIRSQLHARGLLGEEEHTFVRLEPANLTAAERGDPLSYPEGELMLQFHQNARGFKKGQRLAVGDGGGTVPAAALAQADKFQVYRRGAVPLAVNDRVRITANGFTQEGKHRLNNGALFTVQGLTPQGHLVVEHGWVIDKEYGHLAPGYVVTSHAAQGKTVDRVLIGQSSTSFPASSREQFYVSASRARERLVLYTDDKARLQKAIQHSDPRLSALDLLKPKRPPRLRSRVAFLQRLAEQAREHVTRVQEKGRELFQAQGVGYER